MKSKVHLFIFVFFCLYTSAQNKTYYISSTGNDLNDGSSTSTAWKTLSPVNQLILKTGDSILLQGGEVFTGYLELDGNDHGTKNNPITITSYGNGRATIYATGHTAIYAHNADGIKIFKLDIKGNGSNYNGIYFLIDQLNSDLNNIFIDSVDVFNFGDRGLLIGADNTDKGFNDVTILHSSFHDNGVAGMQIFGYLYSFSHTGVTIGYCKFYDNLGTYSATQNTGTGIALSGVDGAIIQYCEAYNNGANNRLTNGGPYGIWAYDAKNVIIQFCESHHNKTGSLKDGGGFDLDGGSQHCTIQYCYSHDNEGPGFALVEYGSANEFTGNVIRYNISQNDGRKNNYGAITLYAADNLHQVKNSWIYNNTIYVDANSVVNGSPAVFSIESGNIVNTGVGNNIFYTTTGIDLIRSTNTFSTSEIYFQNNNYYSTSSSYNFSWGGNFYSSFSSWKTAATGQEMDGNISLGIVQNPQLIAAGTGVTVHPADGASFSLLFGYSLSSLSPLIDIGITLGSMGTHDFFGTSIPFGLNYDIGAAEFVGGVVLPVTITNLEGYIKANRVALKWMVANEQFLQHYEVQRSFNGNFYTSVGYIPAVGKYLYQFSDKYDGSAFYRLKIIDMNGSSQYSNAIRVSKTSVSKVNAYYQPGQGINLHLFTENKIKSSVGIYSETGRLVYSCTYNLSSGENSFNISDAVKWSNGFYIIRVTADNTSSYKLVKW